MLSITKIRTTIIALVAALAALALPASALAESPTVWRYGPTVAQPLPAHPYDLSLTTSTHPPKFSLVYGFTTCAGAAYGVELDWARHGNRQWEFQRQAGHPATKAITGTERIALYNHFIGKYLIREDQIFGISLDFSATPSYEWQIADGQGNEAELYNTHEQAYLVEENVVRGICQGVDLRWLHAPFSLPPGYQPPSENNRREVLPEAPPEPPKNAPEAGSPVPPKNAPESGSPPPTRKTPTTPTPPAAK